MDKKTARKEKTVEVGSSGKKGGRPPFCFKPEEIEIFGKFRATQETMAEHYGVSIDTIRRKMQDEEGAFCMAYKKGFSQTKMKLAEAQMYCALVDHNPTMLIWLGKQYLGQRDEIHQDVDVSQVAFVVDKTDLNA